MRRTVEAKLLEIERSNMWTFLVNNGEHIQDGTRVVAFFLSGRNTPPAGQAVELSWDEPEPQPPCDHVSFCGGVERFQYIVNDAAGEPFVHVWVNYCPVCGARVPDGYHG